MQPDIYQFVLRPLLFSGLNVDPEWLQQQMINTIGRMQNHPSSASHWLNQQFDRIYCTQSPTLEQTLLGLSFKNPVGLAAGFDKDGKAAGFWHHLGFGFAELGTVTWHAQPGNPKPRLFRLPKDGAAINRMGFNNSGSQAMATYLRQLWNNYPSPIPIGINLGKSKITSLTAAAQDYVNSFNVLQDLGDYFVVNVSSPNTPGLRSLQASEQLEPILAALQSANHNNKPLMLKISPDLDWDAIASIISLAQTYSLAGIIATNTTITRDGLKTPVIRKTGKPPKEENGGLSGQPVRQRSTDIIRFIYRETQGDLPIIGVGGIFTAEDAWDKITAGASLVQVYTGWIYEGPWMIKRIVESLINKLEQSKLTHLSEAVGLAAP
ncbi:MAG: quinone-dependent dihydroorotate dehydrogenase [Cyanobacteria bacterium P01_F01_bin.150]